MQCPRCNAHMSQCQLLGAKLWTANQEIKHKGAENKQLREWLKYYAKHDRTCALNMQYEYKECTCGYADIEDKLSEMEKA